MSRAPAQAPARQAAKEERHTARGFSVGLVLICAAALILLLYFHDRPAGYSSGFTVDADAMDGTRAADTSGYWSAEGKININKAPADLLEMLPGIGPALAERIVEGRPYESIEDVTRVSGIGEATYANLKDLICTE